MFSWIEFALALLKVANTLITWGRERELISAGQDQAIAQASAAILVKSQFAKATMQQMSTLNEQQTDDVLKQLEK